MLKLLLLLLHTAEIRRRRCGETIAEVGVTYIYGVLEKASKEPGEIISVRVGGEIKEGMNLSTSWVKDAKECDDRQ